MTFIKKNLVFFIFIVVAVLVAAAGVVMALGAAGAVSDAEQRLSAAKQQRSSLLESNPAPTDANLTASAANVAALESELAEIRDDLRSGSRLNVSDDPISVMAGIQQYISDFRRRAAAHVPENVRDSEDPEAIDEAAGIELPEGFAFGFERYSEEADPPEDPRKVALLDKQRQILTYLMNQLIGSDPVRIRSVRRELVEIEPGENTSNESKGFRISPAVSAREEGAIETMAFALKFDGKTDALRQFLNRLAEFEMPIVVGSIEVSRPSGSEAVVAPSEGGGGLEEIFGAFGGEGEGDDEPITEDSEARDPIIENIDSTFTVVLEYIEIVLPENDASSDDANEEDVS